MWPLSYISIGTTVHKKGYKNKDFTTLSSHTVKNLNCAGTYIFNNYILQDVYLSPSWDINHKAIYYHL